MPANDYNVVYIKISLFLLSFGLYFTINVIFFNDDKIHKEYKNKGVYDIIFQIPQIIYSTIISIIINKILKYFSLSEKNILYIKDEKNILKMDEESKRIEKCIIIKFVLFFIISFIFMVFFWYFISTFCSVYINTQHALIKDTLLSFLLSMIYPFGINLLPGIFRIYALRAKNKDKNYLYKISIILAFF